MARYVVPLLLAGCVATGVPDAGTTKDVFPIPAIPHAPRTYVCARAPSPPVIDGRLDDAAWASAPWTEEFVDIRGGDWPAPRHATRAKLLWDDTYLYVAAWMDEPHVWATYDVRDSVIYHENDFEVFLDPDGDTHHYAELEINALGTEWDLFLVRPYRDGGPALHAWDIPGLRTAVRVDGTVNDPTDVDRGWSVEIAFPWLALAEATGTLHPPQRGDRWRLNFSRVQWRTEHTTGRYVKLMSTVTGNALPEDNWVWSPQGLVAMHYPEMWGVLQFAEDASEPVSEDSEDAARWALYRVYYAQRGWRDRHDGYTSRPADLDLEAPTLGPGWVWPPDLAVTPSGFEARLRGPDDRVLSIREDGRMRRAPK